MRDVSPRFLQAVRSSHRVVVRVDAQLDGRVIATDLPVVGGGVDVDRQAGVRRQATIQLATELIAPAVREQLTPYGTELIVSRGIRYPNGDTELAQLGVFGIVAQRRDHNGPTTYTCADRAARLIAAKFEVPRRTPYVTGIETLHRLLGDVFPPRYTYPEGDGEPVENLGGAQLINLVPPPNPGDIRVGGTTGPTTAAPVTYWDRERWEAMTALARGRELYFDPDGNLVIREIQPVSAPASWLVNAGPDGVLVTYSRDITREETFNVVVVTGERIDSEPVWGGAADVEPDSPTRITGPFGRVPYFVQSPLVTTAAAANDLAQQYLATKRELRRTVSLSLVPNAALDVGDVILVVLPDGTTERHVVDRLRVPLDASSAMTIDTRTSAPDPYVYSPPTGPAVAPPGKPSEPNPAVEPPTDNGAGGAP